MPQHAEEQQWRWNTTPWTRIWQPNWILLKNNIVLYKITEGLTCWKNNKPYSDKHFNGQPSLQLFTLFNLTARAVLIVNLLQQRLSALLSHVWWFALNPETQKWLLLYFWIEFGSEDDLGDEIWFICLVFVFLRVRVHMKSTKNHWWLIILTWLWLLCLVIGIIACVRYSLQKS